MVTPPGYFFQLVPPHTASKVAKLSFVIIMAAPLTGVPSQFNFSTSLTYHLKKNISWEPLRSIRVDTWRILVSFTIFGVAPPQYNKDSPIWIYWREYRGVVRGVAHMAHNWPLPFISPPLRPTRLTQRMFSHPQDVRYWPGGQLLHTLPTTLQRVDLLSVSAT